MALDEPTESQLLAYVYGEMSATEARAFEQRLAGDAELRAEVEGMKAQRELFGGDARWGIDSKVDLPPAHLVDAIVRAEVLARAPEIRDARAVSLTPKTTFTARLSRWLVGGGLVAGAAAALLIVVARPGGDMMIAAAPESAPVATPSAQAPAAAESPPPAPQPDGALRDLGDDTGADFEEAKKTEAPGDKLADGRARGFEAPSPAAEPADAKPADPMPLGDVTVPHGVAARLELGERDARSAGAKQDAAKDAPAREVAAPTASSKPAPEPLEKNEAKSARAQDRGDFDFDMKSNAAGAGGASPASGALAPPPPPPPPSPPASRPVPILASPTSSGRVSADPKPSAAPAPMSPPSEAPALARRPGAALDVITDEKLQTERRKLAEARAKSAPKKKAKASPKDGAKEEAKAPAKGGKAYADDAAGPVTGVAAPEQKRQLQADVALVSGYRELKEGRALDALDEFQTAERLDARRMLGSEPHVGQMRALVAMKRPQEALIIGRRLLWRSVKEASVVDGVLLTAQLSEQLGDLRTAREAWTVLSNVAAHRAAAQAALSRLADPAVRAAQPAPAAVDSSAESEATK